MDTSSYLKRLNIDKVIGLNIEDLNLIHTKHLINIPFENFDIHIYSAITLNKDKLFNKIIHNRRGGICYELNYLLYLFLKELGFSVSLLGGSVFGNRISELDHLFLKASIENSDYLVDVGFGDNFFKPIKFICDIEQHDVKGVFKVEYIEGNEFRLLKKCGNNFEVEYTFLNQDRDINEFYNRKEWIVNSNQSIFRTNLFCSIEMENGRQSLKQDKKIINISEERKEVAINSFEDFLQQLIAFNISLTQKEKDILSEKFMNYW